MSDQIEVAVVAGARSSAGLARAVYVKEQWAIREQSSLWWPHAAIRRKAKDESVQRGDEFILGAFMAAPEKGTWVHGYFDAGFKARKAEIDRKGGWA